MYVSILIYLETALTPMNKLTFLFVLIISFSLLSLAASQSISSEVSLDINNLNNKDKVMFDMVSLIAQDLELSMKEMKVTKMIKRTFDNGVIQA